MLNERRRVSAGCFLTGLVAKNQKPAQRIAKTAAAGAISEAVCDTHSKIRVCSCSTADLHARYASVATWVERAVMSGLLLHCFS